MSKPIRKKIKKFRLNNVKKIALMVILVFGVAVFGTVFLRSSNAAPTWQLVKTENFNTINSGEWSVINNAIYTRSLAIYKDDNAYIKDGSLVLRTERHCVSDSVSITNSNKTNIENYINSSTASVGVCPAGTKAHYSSGKVDSGFMVPTGRIEIRAKIPTQQKGYFLGLWLRNESPWPSPGQSSPLYGELDISEIYGHSPTDQTATSHFGVYADGNTADMHHLYRHPVNNPISVDKGGWHDFAIEWDETGVVYYYDGNKMDLQGGDKKSSDTDYYKDTFTDVQADEHPQASSFTEQQFKDIMNQPWKTLLEVQVHKSTTPDDTKPFNVMETYIDYIKYYEKSSTTEPPSQTKLATPINLIATPKNGAVTLNWGAVANANNYTVRWGQGGVWTNYSNSPGTNPTTTTYTVTGLTNGQTYNFSVAARDSTSTYTNGDYSAGINSVPISVAIRGDTDNNSKVDIQDLANLLSKWGQNYPAYDYGPNGKIDIVDLSILLNNWTG